MTSTTATSYDRLRAEIAAEMSGNWSRAVAQMLEGQLAFLPEPPIVVEHLRHGAPLHSATIEPLLIAKDNLAAAENAASPTQQPQARAFRALA